MEQRCGERKPVGLDVVVSCPRIGLLRGKTDDIGLGGMFIHAQMINMPLGASVTVTFQPDPDHSQLCVAVKGEVVHQGLRGFGLRFVCLENACKKTLQGLMDVEDKGLPVTYPLSIQAV